MPKIVIGLLVCLLIGAGCRFFLLPLPSPPVLTGALLVIAMTSGYVVVDRWIARHPASTHELCGGPTGESSSRASATNSRNPL